MVRQKHKRIRSKYFWDHVEMKHWTECWPFIGAKNKAGYGTIRVDGKLMLAHRRAYELSHNGIPEGKIVCHHCNNQICCNPAHIYAGTHADNHKDQVYAGHQLYGRYHKLSGERSPNAKLTWEQVHHIRKSKEKPSALARKYNVTYATIYNIIKGKTWDE